MAESPGSAASSSAQSQVRYRAAFTPQAWIKDVAYDVDAEGDTEWDCTRAYNEHADYFQALQASMDKGDLDDHVFGILDNDDVLRHDPDAPEWVRNWSGPFSIHVFREVNDDVTAAPSLAERLDSLIQDGLTFGEAVNIFAAHQDSDLRPFVTGAQDHIVRDGEIEVDDNAIVSESADNGNYVMAWVWVTNAQAGVKDEDEDD